jgi:hypothetical protein
MLNIFALNGLFVLHEISSDDTLIHFLSLSVALRILIGERLAVENVHHTFAHKPLL